MRLQVDIQTCPNNFTNVFTYTYLDFSHILRAVFLRQVESPSSNISFKKFTRKQIKLMLSFLLCLACKININSIRSENKLIYNRINRNFSFKKTFFNIFMFFFPLRKKPFHLLSTLFNISIFEEKRRFR
jgi:hypothetical protein